MRRHVTNCKEESANRLPAPLRSFLDSAIARILADFAETAPYLGTQVSLWMHNLSPTASVADYFDQPRIFPTLLLPWWMTRAGCATPDLAFHRDLVYSSVNGYYFIRLVDNLMDGHSSAEMKLLPAAAFFHTEFMRVYQQYFSADHPFWQLFRKTWMRANDAAARGAGTAEFGSEEFATITVAKIAAAEIPLTAAAYHMGRPDLLPPWLDFCKRLAHWFQIMDDLFDWHRDLHSGQTSYLLSEARCRKAAEESVEAWMLREGVDRGMDRLQSGLQELKAQVRALDSEDAELFLFERGQLLAQDRAELRAGLNTLLEAARILDLCS